MTMASDFLTATLKIEASEVLTLKVLSEQKYLQQRILYSTNIIN